MSKNEVLIRKIQELVESTCRQECCKPGYGAWTHHILQVVKYANFLAEKLNADKEIVELAALLHDYSSVNGTGDQDEHHIVSAELAEQLLNKYDYPKDKIKIIKHCIISHRGSRNITRESLEADIIACADAMAHFDNVDSLLYLAYTKHKMDIDQGTQWVLDKLERSWQKLLPEAKEILQIKYNSIKIAFNKSMNVQE